MLPIVHFYSGLYLDHTEHSHLAHIPYYGPYMAWHRMPTVPDCCQKWPRSVWYLGIWVPWEHQMEEAFGRKRTKYEELAEECRSRKWRTQKTHQSQKQGIRQPVSHQGTQDAGIQGLHNRKAIKTKTDLAEKVSRWITQVTETQAGAWSTPAGSPGRGCLMLEDLKHPMSSGYITDDVKLHPKCVLELIHLFDVGSQSHSLEELPAIRTLRTFTFLKSNE